MFAVRVCVRVCVRAAPCHFDGSSNFLCQLRGCKRVLLFSPAEGLRLYPYPAGHAMDNFAMYDPEEAAGAGVGAAAAAASAEARRRFPAATAASGLRATLREGEVLWLPKYW